MPNLEPRDEYGPSGSVPSVSPSTEGPGERVRAEATPGAFGAQEGQAKQAYGGAVTGAGQAVNEEVDKFYKMAVEAKADNAIVKEWAPTAAQLRADYDSLRGQDKIPGYDAYVKGLQAGADKFIEGAGGAYERQIRSHWVTQHIRDDINGAKRQQVEAIQQLQDDGNAEMLLLNQGFAVKNYADPTAVQQSKSMINGRILKQAVDAGANPNEPIHAEMIKLQQKQTWGETSAGMVGKAIQDGNIDIATKIYDQNRQYIPAHEQVVIEQTLHTAAIRDISKNNVAAITNGLPLPDGVGRPPIQTQIAIVRAADVSGVDGNQALTIARIESRYGQNVGKRGDIGQTGKPGTIEEQSANMAQAIKHAESQASTALGRKAEPWETYLTYQQGAGGGPALMRAAVENPNARAVDVLRPLYKNGADAIAAITDNGGNTTMTSGQFMDSIKKIYGVNESAARCEIPGSIPQKSLADAMIDQHTAYGQALQKGSNAKDDLVNFDKAYMGAMAQARLIVNIDEREGTIKGLNRMHENYSAAAQAYGTVINDQIETILKDPKFTDVSAIPPELAAEMTPQQLNYADRVAESNLEKASGITSRDMKAYGPGMFNLMRDIHSGAVKSPEELLQYLPDPKTGKSGEITLEGYKQLLTEFTKTPEKTSEARIRTEALSIVKSQIMNEVGGMKDPEGLKRWSTAMPALMSAWDKGIADGIPAYELADPNNIKYFGNSVKPLIRTPTQKAIDSLAIRPLNSIIADYKATTFQWRKDELLNEMKESGYNVVDDTQSTMLHAPVSR